MPTFEDFFSCGLRHMNKWGFKCVALADRNKKCFASMKEVAVVWRPRLIFSAVLMSFKSRVVKILMSLTPSLHPIARFTWWTSHVAPLKTYTILSHHLLCCTGAHGNILVSVSKICCGYLVQN